MKPTAMTLILLVACVGGPDSADTADTDTAGQDRTCVDIEAEFAAETTAIRSCTEAAECGQVLTGTSCGCTQDWVARLDADPTAFQALLAEGTTAGCELGTASDCRCPEADGYDCVDLVCTWNYVTDPVAYPACEADEGQATTIDSVTLDGDRLSVLVGYGGGCSTHWFTTCWPDQSFLESAPVQAHLELLHEVDEPDPCDAWIMEEVIVDLLPLQRAYEESYGAGGTIIVGLGGYSVPYSF